MNFWILLFNLSVSWTTLVFADNDNELVQTTIDFFSTSSSTTTEEYDFFAKKEEDLDHLPAYAKKYIFKSQPREQDAWVLRPLADDLPLLEKIPCHKCPRVHIPVCGDDHQTYLNICKMACRARQTDREIKVASIGYCYNFLDRWNYPVVLATGAQGAPKNVTTIQVTPSTYFYNTTKQALRQYIEVATPKSLGDTVNQLVVQLLPPLNEFMPCEKCPRVYFPVCGSNGKSFRNICFFKCNKLEELGISIVRRGICVNYRRDDQGMAHIF